MNLHRSLAAIDRGDLMVSFKLQLIWALILVVFCAQIKLGFWTRV